MKIYRMGYKEGYKSYSMKEKVTRREINAFRNLDKLMNNYEKKEMIVSESAKRADLAYIFSYPGGVIAITDKAKKIFEKYFEASSFEYLPVVCDEGDYYLVHCINAYNLDLKMEELDNMTFKTYLNETQLNEKKINQKGIFKIKKDNGFISPLYVTEFFVEKIKEVGFDSVSFELIWDSDD